jgi:uncharacterized membrane protein YbaN (DUF454 family)
MLKNTKRAAVLIVGFVFVILGILGLFLPFLQGILFLVIGLLLLSAYSPSLREWMQTHTRKYPKLHYWVLRAEAWIERIIGKPE